VVREYADRSYSPTLRGAGYAFSSVDASDLRSTHGGDSRDYDVDHGVRCVR
jgi:hypothetical protein